MSPSRAPAAPFFGCTPVGIARRLRGLAAQGYSTEWAAAQLGWDVDRLRRLRQGERRQVDHIAAHDLHVLCESVADRCPIWGQVRATWAAQQSWAPLTAWLPGEIDDPASRSDLAYRRRHDPAARIDVTELDWLRAGGASVHEIARRLRVRPGSIARADERRASTTRAAPRPDEGLAPPQPRAAI